MTRAVLAALFLVVGLGWALAVEPNERLTDPALEARARALSKELRCLVCQNESIDDSNATLAHDLRLLLRERIAAGDSDQQVKQFMVSRYGDFVLLRPPLEPATYLLWFGPAVLLALGATGAVVYLRHRKSGDAPPPLSADEERRVAQLLRDET